MTGQFEGTTRSHESFFPALRRFPFFGPSQIDADEPMTEAITNGNARYELPADTRAERDFEREVDEFAREMEKYVTELTDGEQPLGNLEPSELPTELILEDTQKDSNGVLDVFETPNPKILGSQNNPIDLTKTDHTICLLGLELMRTETEFKLLHELDNWAAAKAAHLWLRAEEDEQLKKTSSYRLIQALAYELKEVAKCIEF